MQIEGRSEERIAVLSDTIQRSRFLHHFTCDMHRERRKHVRLPRTAVLAPNLHHGRQDLSNLEARTSTDHQSKQSEEYGEETRSGNIDFRIQGLPHSTVQKSDDVRRETVKRLIHQFETHPDRESLMTDLKKALYVVRAANACSLRSESSTKPTICSKTPGESSAAQSWKGSKQIFFIRNH